MFIDELLQLKFSPTQKQLRQHRWLAEAKLRIFIACWLETLTLVTK